MSETQAKQAGDELFQKSPAIDATTDKAAAPEANAKANPEKESETIELEGEQKQDSDVPSNQEAMKAKQINSWTKKVLAGEANLESLPENQRWLRPEIEARLERLSQSAPVIERLVEKKLVEKEESNKFTHLQAQLNAIDLNKNQQDAIRAEYNELVAAGLPKSKALDKAIKLAGVDLSQDPDDLFRTATRMPKASDYHQPESKPLKQMSSDERVAYYEKLRKAGK